VTTDIASVPTDCIGALQWRMRRYIAKLHTARVNTLDNGGEQHD
jgi:hypothetical protein